MFGKTTTSVTNASTNFRQTLSTYQATYFGTLSNVDRILPGKHYVTSNTRNENTIKALFVEESNPKEFEVLSNSHLENLYLDNLLRTVTGLSSPELELITSFNIVMVMQASLLQGNTSKGLHTALEDLRTWIKEENNVKKSSKQEVLRHI
ncbi:hypothetical protein GJ496_008213 [Pomphorhynchus laevis]|nr:hypothetical protein GJ496_008213 [Pomphorhynchus laevis]